MNSCIVFNYLAITSTTRSFGGSIGQIRTVPQNNYGQQSGYSNDYSGTSALTRSSSTYGGSGDDSVQSRVNTGGYGGAGGLDSGSDRYFFSVFL